MKIKDITSQAIIDIRCEMNRYKRTTDKEIAKELEITPASLSRLYNKTTTPHILTWWKIITMHAKYCGMQRNTELLSKLET